MKWSVRKLRFYSTEEINYGTFTNFEDIKALVKGYSLNKELKRLFELIIYTRKNSQYYFEVEEIKG